MADQQSEPAGKRTETTVREYDEAGKLTRETATVVQVSADDEKPWPGQYL